MAAAEIVVGDQWQDLVDEGRSMTVDQIIDSSCAALATIC